MMSLIQSAVSALKNLRKYSAGISPQLLGNNQPVHPKISDELLVKKYRGWTYIAASRNAAAIAMTPIRLYATVDKGEDLPRSRSGNPGRILDANEKAQLLEKYKTDKQMSARLLRAEQVVEIFDHPFIDLMNKPNRWRTSFEFFEETSIFSDITGDSYWQITMDRRLKIPKELYLLPSQYVKIVPDKTKFIKGYMYGRGIDKIAYKPEEILHFRNGNPEDPYYGLGCLEASLTAVNNYDAMDLYENSLNNNKGVPGVLVSYKGRIKDDQIKQLESDWNRTMRGLKNQGKTKVTSQEYDVKEMGFSPREMGFLQGRKWTRLEIADAFGVPISLLDTENVNKANAQAGNEQYGRFTIAPRLQRIEDKINDELLPFYNEPRIFAAFDNPVPEDREFLSKQANESFKSNLITQNEGRKMIGLGSIGGGQRLSVEITEGAKATEDTTPPPPLDDDIIPVSGGVVDDE